MANKFKDLPIDMTEEQAELCLAGFLTAAMECKNGELLPPPDEYDRWFQLGHQFFWEVGGGND